MKLNKVLLFITVAMGLCTSLSAQERGKFRPDQIVPLPQGADPSMYGSESEERPQTTTRKRSNNSSYNRNSNYNSNSNRLIDPANVRLGIGHPRYGERVIDVTFACSDGDLQTVTVYARSKATQSMVIKKALEGVNPFVRATEIVSIKDAAGIIYYDR